MLLATSWGPGSCQQSESQRMDIDAREIRTSRQSWAALRIFGNQIRVGQNNTKIGTRFSIAKDLAVTRVLTQDDVKIACWINDVNPQNGSQVGPPFVIGNPPQLHGLPAYPQLNCNRVLVKSLKPGCGHVSAPMPQ